jgi:hypothetical protein
MTMNELRRMLTDARAKGAQATHWGDIDQILKRESGARSMQRAELRRELDEPRLSILPRAGASTAALEDKMRRLDDEIAAIDEMRREVAAEIEQISAPNAL